jgi:hypothetical protein
MARQEHPDEIKIQEYRAKAIQAAEKAISAKDSFTRGSWENIAQAYHEMADRLDRSSKL